MKPVLFILGAIILLFSFVFWSYDQPRVDLFTSGVGQLALMNEQVREQYTSLQEEIFWAKIGMIIGIIIIIPSLVLGRKQSSVLYCNYCNHASSTEAELINHLTSNHQKEVEKDRIQLEEITARQRKRHSIKNKAILIGVIIGVVGGAGFMGFWMFGLPSSGFVAFGTGMEPFFYEGDFLAMTKVPFKEIVVGDVIVYRNPSDPSKVTAHRVVATIDDNPKTLRAKGDANPASIPGTDFPISENQYIGRIDNVLPQFGAIIGSYYTAFAITAIIFVIPVVTMHFRAKKKISQIT